LYQTHTVLMRDFRAINTHRVLAVQGRCRGWRL